VQRLAGEPLGLALFGVAQPGAGPSPAATPGVSDFPEA